MTRSPRFTSRCFTSRGFTSRCFNSRARVALLAATLCLPQYGFAAEYLCTFETNSPGSGYAGSHVFSTDTADDAPLACGQVQARRQKLAAYHLVHHGQLRIDWAGASQSLNNGGYYQVRIDQVSLADGAPCRLEMEVGLSGATLYRGALLETFGAAATGSGGGSGVSTLRWTINGNGQPTALIDRSVSLGSFDGTAAFSCARIH